MIYIDRISGYIVDWIYLDMPHSLDTGHDAEKLNLWYHVYEAIFFCKEDLALSAK